MPRSTKKSNLVEARARMYRELVFDCAERVFAEDGFAASSMQDLAAEAGISLKTLYAAFPGKDDIYRAILAERGAGLLAEVRAAAQQEGNALERLHAGIRGIVGYLIEHESFFRILLQEGHAWGLDPQSKDAKEAWSGGLLSVRELIEDGVRSGEFLPCDPDLLAPTVNAVLQVQLAGLIARGDEPDADAIAAEILQSMARLLCGEDRAVTDAA
ncbi:MAG: TetR/AcrR family transcriptional regulator [Myxococcota bacterium]